MAAGPYRFGEISALVSIPVQIFSASRNAGPISFNQIPGKSRKAA